MAVVAIVLGGLLLAPTAKARSDKIVLPSAPAEIRAQIQAEKLLRGGKGPERTLPGPVKDVEEVDVGIDTIGTPVDVSVRQRLKLSGVGDYFVKIPGPVKDVEPLPSSSATPGLRNGSIVWQGFSQGDEVLGARAQLAPQEESDRLPLVVSVRAEVDGEPVEDAESLSGRLSLQVKVKNSASALVSLPSGAADPREVAEALDALHEQLAEGTAPVPGRGGIPESLAATSDVSLQETRVVAPLEVNVQIVLPEEADNIRAASGVLKESGSNARVMVDELLSGSSLSATVEVTADIDSGSLPEVRILAEPSLPSPDSVSPDGGGSWTQALGNTGISAHDMVDRLVGTLAEAARLSHANAYLGNPDLDGHSSSTYRYELVGSAPLTNADPGPGSPTPERLNSLGLLLTIIAGIVLLIALLTWWALS